MVMEPATTTIHHPMLTPQSRSSRQHAQDCEDKHTEAWGKGDGRGRRNQQSTCTRVIRQSSSVPKCDLQETDVRRPKNRKVARGKQLHLPGGSTLTTSDLGVPCSAQRTHNHGKRCRSESLVSRGRLDIGQGTGLPKSFAIANTKQEHCNARGQHDAKGVPEKSGNTHTEVEG